jgi:hypothetical protein
MSIDISGVSAVARVSVVAAVPTAVDFLFPPGVSIISGVPAIPGVPSVVVSLLLSASLLLLLRLRLLYVILQCCRPSSCSVLKIQAF